MIVISGILLLIAVVFLVIGLFGPLAWVYASIAVSVLSFVFLLVGVRQRRDIAPAGAATPAAPRGALPTEPATADVTLVPAGGRRPTPAAAPVAAAVLDDAEKAAPARVPARTRSAAAAPARPAARPRTATGSAASNRLRGTGTRPRAVLPARLAESGTAAKKAAPAKAAAKKAPAKAASKKAAPAKAAAKKAAPAKKAPAKAAAKKAAPAKKTAAKKAPAKKATGR